MTAHALRSWRAWPAAPLLVAAAVLAGCGSSPPAGSPSGSAGPAPTGPIKVFAYVAPPMRSISQVDSEASKLRSTDAYGISWKFAWSTIEPSDGVFDWSLIDRALQDTQADGKRAMLRVIAGVNSPAWIAQGGHALAFSGSSLFTPTNGSVTMPIPWDPTFLSAWGRFIAAFGQRYSTNPLIWSVQMTGGGYIGEMLLPLDTAEWQQAGYSDAKITSAWETIITDYRRAFPTIPTNLDIDEPLGKGDHALPGILAWVLRTYPHQVYLQQNGLRAAYANNLNQYRQDLRMASAVTTVGYQMYGGANTKLDANTGDRMTAFQVAISDHASYVEVYTGDLLDASLASDIRYLISGGRSG